MILPDLKLYLFTVFQREDFNTSMIVTQIQDDKQIYPTFEQYISYSYDLGRIEKV
jgi:hypothetical protein